MIDIEKFKDSFKNQLFHILDGIRDNEMQSYSLFVLALSNISLMKQLREDYELKNMLFNKYDLLSEHITIYLDNSEDFDIFKKIVSFQKDNKFDNNTLLDNLSKERKVSDFNLKFNKIREFRPERESKEKFLTNFKDFDEIKFNFNKKFLKKEIIFDDDFFIDKEFKDRFTFFYNKFPFVEYHTVIVPDKDKNNPQFLSSEYHNLICDFMKNIKLKNKKEIVGIGFSAYGAFASVNHLHFQFFIEDLPILDEKWEHNGGNCQYPAKIYKFNDFYSSWQQIDYFNKNNITYNVCYTTDSIFCLPRQFQSEYPKQNWSKGFGWYEMTGGFISFTYNDFNRITKKEIDQDFKNISFKT